MKGADFLTLNIILLIKLYGRKNNMKKLLRKSTILILTLAIGILTLTFSITDTNAATVVFRKNNTYCEKYISKVSDITFKYVFHGTTRLTAEEVYQTVIPATYAEAKQIANLWNGGKPSEIIAIVVTEDPVCKYNPGYCSSIGKPSLSKVEYYDKYASWDNYVNEHNGMYMWW